jgi:hypothetical protein
LSDSPLIQAIQALSSSALQPTPQTFTDAEKVQISTNLGLSFPIDAVTALGSVYIPAGISQLQFNGYYVAGDGGGHYKARVSTPTVVMPWHMQSADGAWWQIVGPAVDVRMLGARASNSSMDAVANATAIQNAVNFKYMVYGGGKVTLSGIFYIADTIFTPMATWLEGDGRHQVLTEYGDTTSGVAHPSNDQHLRFH